MFRRTLIVATLVSMLAMLTFGPALAVKPNRNQAPTVTAFDVPPTSSSPVAINIFTAADSDGTIAGYLVTESAAEPDPGNPNWSATAPASYATTTVGPVTLYAWAKDDDGAVSASLNDIVDIPDPLEQRVTALEAQVQILQTKVEHICDLYFLTGNSASAPAFCGDAKTVFVSSTEYHGYMGSVSVYDAECQSLAAAAGLAGTFRAWLSNGTQPASNFTRTNADYVLVDGTVVANGWSDLTDGFLDNPISLTESGTTPVGSDQVWTGTDPGGFGYSPPNTCEGWMDPGGSGTTGSWSMTDNNWTDYRGNGCNLALHHIYCFEQ